MVGRLVKFSVPLFCIFVGWTLAATIPKPFNVTARDETSTSALLEWELEQFDNVTCIGYLLINNTFKKYNLELNTSVLIQNLKPYQLYEFQVRACLGNNCSDPGTVAFQTKMDAPGQPENVDTEFRENSFWTVYVTWEEPTEKNGPISGYAVHLCEDKDQQGKCWFQNVTITNTSFNGLSLRSKYNLTIRAFNTELNGTALYGPKSTHIFRTGVVAPPPPNGLRFENVTSTKFTIIWNPIDENSTYIVDYYQVGINGPPSVNLSDFKLPQENLKPWTNFTVTLQGCAIDQLGPDGEKGPFCSEAVTESITTEVDAPGLPENVDTEFRENSFWTVYVTWEEPTEKNGPISGYAVHLCEDKDRQGKCWFQNVTITNTSFNGLSLLSKYNLTIRAFNMELNGTALYGPEFTHTFRTGVVAPPPPNGLQFENVTSTKFPIKWNPIDKNSRYIVDYYLVGINNLTGIKVSGFKLPRTNLKPWTNFTVTLQGCAVDKLGLDGEKGPFCSEAVTESITTEVDVPGVPENLECESRNWSVHATWKEPADKNGPLTGYTASVCSKGLDEDCLIQNVSSTNADFNGLRLRTPYECRVFAFNTGANGTYLPGPKALKSFTTGVVAPPPVKGLRKVNVTATSFEVMWDPLEQGSEYIVDLYNVNSKGIEYAVRNGTRFFQKDLTPWTNHTFIVQACASITPVREICGEETTMLIRTKPTVPGKVRNLYRTFPRPWTALVTWDRPFDTNGPLDGYLVTWNGAGIQDSSYVRNSSCVIPNLSLRSQYTVRVKACNNRTSEDEADTEIDPSLDKVCGTEEMLNLTTPVTPPPVPEGFRKGTITATSVELYWNNIDSWSKYIIDRFWLTEEKEELDINITQDNREEDFSYMINNLEPWTNYTFKLRACVKDPNINKYVCGDESILKIETKVGIPGEVRNLSQNFSDPWTLQLFWEDPLKTNGPLDGYHLIWNGTGVQNSAYVKNHSCVIPDLSLRSQYTVRVKACNNRSSEDEADTEIDPSFDKVCGSGKSLDVITSITTPPVPMGLREGNVTATSIELLWDKIDPTSKYIIDSFRLTAKGQTFSIEQDFLFVVDNLEPWTNYTFKLRACVKDTQENGNEQCGGEATRDAWTKAGIPGQISAVNVTTDSWSSLRLDWEAPLERNGPINSYNITWFDVQSPESLGTRLEVSTTYVVTGLKANTEYRIQISACNEVDYISVCGEEIKATGTTYEKQEKGHSNMSVVLPAVLVPLVLLLLGSVLILYFKTSKKGPIIGKIMNRGISVPEYERSFENPVYDPRSEPPRMSTFPKIEQ